MQVSALELEVKLADFGDFMTMQSGGTAQQTHESEQHLAGRPLLEQQLLVLIEQEHGEGPVQQPFRLLAVESVRVPFGRAA